MRHILKSGIIFLIAIVLFAGTLIFAEGLVNKLVKEINIEEFSKPLIYSAFIAAYFDILALISEALPISDR